MIASVILRTVRAWPVIFLVTMGVSFLTSFLAARLGLDLPVQNAVTMMRDMAGWNWKFIGNCALILAVAPLVEEFIFRYLLFALPALHLPERNESAIMIVSSVAFSAAHYLTGTNSFPDSACVALAVFGFAQCWLYRRVGTFWSPVLNHFLFNLTNLLLVLYLPERLLT